MMLCCLCLQKSRVRYLYRAEVAQRISQLPGQRFTRTSKRGMTLLSSSLALRTASSNLPLSLEEPAYRRVGTTTRLLEYLQLQTETSLSPAALSTISCQYPVGRYSRNRKEILSRSCFG